MATIKNDPIAGKNPSTRRARIVLAVLIVLALALVVYGVHSSESKQAGDARAQAWAACVSFIRPKVNPGTTPYFQMEDLSQVEKLGEAQYGVQLYVDEYDRFGAVVRRQFSCRVALENGQWDLIELGRIGEAGDFL